MPPTLPNLADFMPEGTGSSADGVNLIDPAKLGLDMPTSQEAPNAEPAKPKKDDGGDGEP